MNIQYQAFDYWCFIVDAQRGIMWEVMFFKIGSKLYGKLYMYVFISIFYYSKQSELWQIYFELKLCELFYDIKRLA